VFPVDIALTTAKDINVKLLERLRGHALWVVVGVTGEPCDVAEGKLNMAWGLGMVNWVAMVCLCGKVKGTKVF